MPAASLLSASAAFRRSRWGTTTYLGSSVEAFPASKTPNRSKAEPAATARPPTTLTDSRAAGRRRWGFRWSPGCSHARRAIIPPPGPPNLPSSSCRTEAARIYCVPVVCCVQPRRRRRPWSGPGPIAGEPLPPPRTRLAEIRKPVPPSPACTASNAGGGPPGPWDWACEDSPSLLPSCSSESRSPEDAAAYAPSY
jgi:hypothetical protein